jgi:hypothetical protein
VGRVMVGPFLAVPMGLIDIALPGAAIGVLLFALFAASRFLTPLIGRAAVWRASIAPRSALGRRAQLNSYIFFCMAASAGLFFFNIESVDAWGGPARVFVVLLTILLPLGVGGVFMWAPIWACSVLFWRMSQRRARFLAGGGSIRRLQVEAVAAVCLLTAAIWLAVVVGSMPR